MHKDARKFSQKSDHKHDFKYLLGEGARAIFTWKKTSIHTFFIQWLWPMYEEVIYQFS